MEPCKIVAEIGINHNGDLETAFQMIKNARDAGCDYVKFQKRTVDLVYTHEELERPRESPWGHTYRDQKEGLEFGETEYDAIDQYCRKLGIEWFASPWDVGSVKSMAAFDPPFLKVSSACLTDHDLLTVIKTTDIPVVLSTGMSTKEEIIAAVEYLGDQLEYILACTSTYPTKVEEVHLSKINLLKDMFPFHKIGYSNHHPGVLFPVVAAVMGAQMVEFHVTLDRAMYGTDQAASIETPGMLKIVDYIRDWEKAKGSMQWCVFPSEEKVKAKLRKHT